MHRSISSPIWHKHAVNSHSLYTIISSLITPLIFLYLSQLLFFRMFSLSPFLCGPLLSFYPTNPIFPSIFMLHIGQISSTPLLYRSMSSPLLSEWPVFCKLSCDLQHIGAEQSHCKGLFRPARTSSLKQVTAPKHCPKFWLPQCVCMNDRERERK